MLLDVLDPFFEDIESVLNRTATSLSTYVNSSLCKHSEISPSVFCLIKSQFGMFRTFALKFFVFFLLYQWHLQVKINNLIKL